MSSRIAAAALTIGAVAAGLVWADRPARSKGGKLTASTASGALLAIDRDGHPSLPCPLKHTSVKAEISGFLARVNVTQEFHNNQSEKVEAVYVFPLPNRAAVDDMTMTVGDRTIKAVIKRREEAQQIFANARNQGHTASLLDQERPNIFTQSVTNIAPGARVTVTISYVETLLYEAGSYQFVFPMVVGPRYISGTPTGKQGGGWAPDTTQVPDGSRITPVVAPEGLRAGHDISLDVKLDAGVPLDAISASTHPVDIARLDSHRATIHLKNQREIPNRDFILRYDVAGRRIEDAVLTHRGAKGGFLTLILQPPDQPRVEDITPKELVFVLDTSGSMSGFPIEKAKEVIKLAMDGLHPRDRFNLITFAGDTNVLFPTPVPATPENVRRAQQFVLSRQGGGGTEMMKAIRAALDPSSSTEHIRVVCFLTDGYVGNDMEIVGEVRKHANARVFSFGIGSSVNRFLLDKLAEEGRGEVEYVGLSDDGSAAALRFHERVRSPLLTDVEIDWAGLPVTDIYPTRIPDLFSGKPLTIAARYSRPASGAIRLKGKSAGRIIERSIPVVLPAAASDHGVLATLWAREKIESLMAQDWAGMQNGNPGGDLKEQITKLGLDFRLMTQFTSFVAVEDKVVAEGGVPKRVQVPVEMPHGISHQGVFGESKQVALRAAAPLALVPPPAAQGAIRINSAGISEGRAEAALDKVADIARPAAMSKLDPQLTSGRRDARFLSNGLARVKVWLEDDSAATVRALESAGLRLTARKAGRLVFGEISLDKLKALAALDAVLYISADLGQP